MRSFQVMPTQYTCTHYLPNSLALKYTIAHGMWLKAHTIASLSPLIKRQSAITISVAFKQRTPLNSEVRINYQEKTTERKLNPNSSRSNSSSPNNTIDFDIRSLDGHKLHMVGCLTYLG